ncbi:GntR family transcriptional regulator [Streptomyces sp. NPDC006798]|uniref:GntR family transcriptional regulator n=1 Tax=Streptomyces sp. NPDC006798 TaxID=3155462 RepID=UPI0033F4571D
MSDGRTGGEPGADTIGGAHLSLRDQVYREVRERIIDGRLPSGRRIVERELAEELGVSRVPVREALQRLESEGFVTVSARRGAFVAPFGPAEAADLFDIRERLEALAAALAADRADTAGLRVLEGLLARARQAAGNPRRTRELASVHADFHRQIVVLSGNPLLLDLMTPLDGRLRRLFGLTTEPADGTAMCGEHELLYAAIRDGSAAEAERIAREHVAGTRAAAMRLLAPADPERPTAGSGPSAPSGPERPPES